MPVVAEVFGNLLVSRVTSSGHGFGQNALANTRYGPAHAYSCVDIKALLNVALSAQE